MANNAYIGNQLFTNSDYYIHEHVHNIGRASNKIALGDGDLAKEYINKREQAHNAVKIQFRDLFKKSVVNNKTSTKALNILSEAMKKDDIMTELNKSMGEALKEALNVKKMQDLMNIYVSLDKIDFDSIVRNNLSQLNNFLEALSKACELIGNKQSGIPLAQYLLNSKNGATSIQQVGSNLLIELETMKAQMEGMPLSNFDIQQINLVSERLSQLGQYLAEGNVNSKTLIRDYCRKIFSEGFAEAISGEIKSTGILAIKNAMDDIKLSGTSDSFQIVYYDEFGNFKQVYGRPQFGKADVIFPNVQFHIKQNGKIESGDVNFTINLGVSDKFYKSVSFPSVENSGVNSTLVSSGGAGLFTKMLEMTVGSDIRYFYLAYNTITYRTELPQAYYALENIIATRAIINLFAARGGNADFAQYMFTNGQIIPIWDIILSMTEFQSKSKSAVALNKLVYRKNKVDVIKGLKDRVPENRAQKIDKIHKINNAINKIYISAELNLRNIGDVIRQETVNLT